MPKTLGLVAQHGVALSATVSATTALSLPGYQALLAGRPTPCGDNDCARIDTETVSEGLVKTLRLPPDQVVTFASWAGLAAAATSRDDSGVTVDAPPRLASTGAGPPWDDARWDAETISRALAHWRSTHPRFMHLALLDMDEWAHRRDVDGTLGALRQADDTIAELWSALSALPEDERRLTTILVTADHGRGPGELWPSHGAFSSSRDVFVLGIGLLVPGGGGGLVTQAQVRPTIERLLGVCPTGAAITAIVGELPCR